MEKKQTAVEYFASEISNILTEEQLSPVISILIKAKELEKQQIVEAFDNGLTIKMDGEQYYSQKYSNK